MGRRNGMVRVIRPLRSTNDVAPPGADFVSGFYREDLGGLRPAWSACELRVVDVGDGVGLRGGAEVGELGMFDAVDGEFLISVRSVGEEMELDLLGRYCGLAPRPQGRRAERCSSWRVSCV